MVGEKLIFLYFILFPFGQILRLEIFPGVTLHPIDLVVFLIALQAFSKNKFPRYIKKFKNLILFMSLSLIFSLYFFKAQEIITGLLYLIRFSVYGLFSVRFWQLGQKKENKKLILNSLLGVSLFIALFGWGQYFLFPDLRALYYLGWDDHFFRLTSTFLDPAFTGILIILATLLLFAYKKYVFLLFLLTTLAFTYSRASFLAFTFGVIFLATKQKALRQALIFVSFLGLVVFFLPRPAGEGVKLTRSRSVILKIQNYKESFDLWQKSPLLGVGFNNICIAKQKFLTEVDNKNKEPSSHSCSGLDNSFLFVLTTIGALGFLIFLEFTISVIRQTSLNLYGQVFLSSLVATSIHSLFTNTLFYPWVMGWLFILLALSRSKRN